MLWILFMKNPRILELFDNNNTNYNFKTKQDRLNYGSIRPILIKKKRNILNYINKPDNFHYINDITQRYRWLVNTLNPSYLLFFYQIKR